jgi:hypothetical protein
MRRSPSLRRGGPLALSALLGLALLVAAPAGAAVPSQVVLDRASFNPALGQAVVLSYRLAAADRVWVRVYDPDSGLVRTVVDGERQEAGARQARWDGRDWQGKLVPDEAYTFTVETGSGDVYDPTVTSGGEVADLTDARFDRQAGTVSYSLPAASRVLIRLGVRNGPMYKTLVDWKPRVVGSVTEYWDGRDEDGLLMLWGRPGFSALITYVTLPDATVVAYGNDAESYRSYKLDRAKGRPQKPERAAAPGRAGRLRPEGLVPAAWARAPRVTLGFPRLAQAGEVPAVSGEITVRVDVAPEDREALLKEQFEIIFYVDDVFFAEAERGYVPFNWRWELDQLPEGEHLLTVNVASFRGQVGVASRKVRVVRPR